MDMSFPFVELYGHNSGSPMIVPGVPVSRWKSDEKALRCSICIKTFNFLRRRHHCRACGDICCRRCLGFCLVNVPQLGVDLAYTCARCIRRHSSDSSLAQDFAQLAQSFDGPRSVRSTRATSRSLVSPAASEYGSPAPSLPGSPCSLASVLSPCGSAYAGSWDTEYKVIVSQYSNQKLHSVCSLLGDYLECKGGAIVLADDDHVWVLGHKGVRSSVLHSDTFLSICHRAVKGDECFSVSKRKRPNQLKDAFHFFAAAPIRFTSDRAAPIGCIVALDAQPRNDIAARKVEKTLANLARLVMNLLVDEQHVLRIFASGDFRIFASNAQDLAPACTTPFEVFGVAPSPTRACTGAGSAAMRATRSRSYASGGDDASFYERYAETHGRVSPRDMDRHAAAAKNPNNRKHAASNPEPAKRAALLASKSASRLWPNDAAMLAA